MTDLKKLRELAASIEGTTFESEDFSGDLLVNHICDEGERYFGFEMPRSIRQYIAAANPETVIALLDKVEATESLNSSLYSEIRRLRSQLAEYENDDELEVNHE